MLVSEVGPYRPLLPYDLVTSSHGILFLLYIALAFLVFFLPFFTVITQYKKTVLLSTPPVELPNYVYI